MHEITDSEKNKMIIMQGAHFVILKSGILWDTKLLFEWALCLLHLCIMQLKINTKEIKIESLQSCNTTCFIHNLLYNIVIIIVQQSFWLTHKGQSYHHIGTSQLISRANQLTGFYMMTILAFHKLTLLIAKRFKKFNLSHQVIKTFE